MTLQERLAEAKAKQRMNIEKANTLEQEKQKILQECLKYEGAIQVLSDLLQEEERKGV
ncbi:MAG: hypothetical protein PHQ43_13390 [Dehalococcoidales bacterium]|nr:hypothetical protein [Dehalococcoidales bacterium]